jgi:hypothetical protein
MDGTDDCHVAWLVTSVVAPLGPVAVATSCRVSPGERLAVALPAADTWTAVVLEGAAGESDPQAAGAAAIASAAMQVHSAGRTEHRVEADIGRKLYG